jgi:hypothetical protein
MTKISRSNKESWFQHAAKDLPNLIPHVTFIFSKYIRGSARDNGMVSRRLPTVVSWVRARVWSCGICGGQSGAGAQGRSIAQAVSRRLLTVVSSVRAQVWSCGICGGQSGAGAGFLQVLRFPLPIFIPPTAPQSAPSIIWDWYNRPVVATVPSGLSLTPLRLIKNRDNGKGRRFLSIIQKIQHAFITTHNFYSLQFPFPSLGYVIKR